MYIPKIRRMVDAIQEIKSIDPETALTHRYIRTMVETKKITTIKYGYAWVVNMDELYAYFTTSGVQSDEDANFWERELGSLIEEHPMFTSKMVCSLFYEHDSGSMIRQPNLRRFVQENNIRYFPINPSKWLINIVDFTTILNPKKINQRASLPRLRGQIKAFNEIIAAYPKLKIDRQLLQNALASENVFKIKNGGHWIINFDEFKQEVIRILEEKN